MSKAPAKKITGTIVSLALVLTIPAASAFSAASCPDVDSARAMLTRAAATQNDRELQAPRQETQASRSQDVQARRVRTFRHRDRGRTSRRLDRGRTSRRLETRTSSRRAPEPRRRARPPSRPT